MDVWIYDHRVRASVWSDEFAANDFPDKALLARQYAEWPLGGRKITPRHAIEILESVGPVLANATRLHQQTACIPNLDVSSNIFRRSGADPSRGAGAGRYACFNRKFHNQKYFRTCWPPLTPLAPPDLDDDSFTDNGQEGSGANHYVRSLLGILLASWTGFCPGVVVG